MPEKMGANDLYLRHTSLRMQLSAARAFIYSVRDDPTLFCSSMDDFGRCGVRINLPREVWLPYAEKEIAVLEARLAKLDAGLKAYLESQ